MNQSFNLLKTLPLVLKLSWVVLVLGEVGLVLGYFTSTGFFSFTGLELLALGMLIAIFDMYSRKAPRDAAAGFHTGVVMAPIFSLVVFIFLLLLVAIAILLDWFLGEGFTGHGALHVLHLSGVLTSLFMVTAIPFLAFRVQKEKQADQAREETIRTKE